MKVNGHTIGCRQQNQKSGKFYSSCLFVCFCTHTCTPIEAVVSNLTCNQNFTSYHSFLGLKFLKNVTMPWCNSSRKLDSLKIMNILQGRKNKELSRRSLCRHFRRQKCALHFQIVNWFVWSCVIVLSNLAVYLWSFDVICPLGLAYAPQKNQPDDQSEPRALVRMTVREAFLNTLKKLLIGPFKFKREAETNVAHNVSVHRP